MSDNDIDKFSAIHWGQGTAALMGAAEGAKYSPEQPVFCGGRFFQKGRSLGSAPMVLCLGGPEGKYLGTQSFYF